VQKSEITLQVKEFNIFGSEDSLDIDIMYKVDKMPTLGECQEYCSLLDTEYSKNSAKEINSNLCVINDGIVVDVYKGTIDEVNNMIFYTYKNHAQLFPCFVERTIPRDVPTKANRALRGILSHISRTHYRDLVKTALKGSMADRIDAVREIDFNTIHSLNKNVSQLKDYHKNVAFQIGQTLGLFQGMELYSKKSISAHFPYLKEMLYREDFDVGMINDIVKHFVTEIESKIENRNHLYEVLKK